MSKRICLVTASLATHGSGNFILELMANYWADVGHEVTILTFGHGVYLDYNFRDSVTHFPLELFFESSSPAGAAVGFYRRLRMIRKAIEEVQPDAVLVMVEDPCIRVILATLGLGIPVVAISHTDILQNQLPLRWKVLQQLVYPLATRTVVLTDKIRASLPYPMRRRCSVIPNPVMPPPQAGLSVKVKRPFIITAGRLLRPKRHKMLIEVFEGLARDFPQWSLVILGEGEERENLQKLISEKGLVGRVLLPGFTDSIGDWLEAAEIFAFPSLYEGFPLALCEAMTCGLPSVVSNYPAGPEAIVRNGENGIIVPLHSSDSFREALSQLMGDDDLRMRMGSEALKITHSFRPNRVLRMWDQLLEDIT